MLQGAPSFLGRLSVVLRRALTTLATIATLSVASCGKVGGADPVDPPAGEPPVSDLGTSCASSSQCASGSCVPLTGAPLGAGVCTVTCESAGECTVGGWSCVPRPGAASLCECAVGAGGCDGRDDDCNGRVDDSPADSACGGGLTCEAGSCVCKGTTCGGACVDTQTDVFHCGACGVTCGEGTTCSAGECRCSPGGALCAPGDGHVCGLDERCHVVTGVDTGTAWEEVRRLRVTVDAIYVATEYRGLSYSITTISRLAKGTGASSVVASLTHGLYGTFDADDAGLAFTTSANPLGATEARPVDSVIYCAADLCPAAPLATGQAASAVALGGGHVYWVDAVSAEVRRCARAGCGNAPELVAAAPAGVTTGAGSQLVSDGALLFVVYPTGLVGRVPFAAASTVTTLTTAAGATRPALDGDTLYVVAAAGVLACPTAGCPAGPRLVAGLGATSVTSVASDGARVYWTESTAPGSVTVASVPKAGGAKVSLLALSADVNVPVPLGVDATSVYAADSTRLQRIDK